ncbi:MAG: WD40/YVTN/BNR-like repeat-containing protein [Lysobacterales bacterium]
MACKHRYSRALPAIALGLTLIGSLAEAAVDFGDLHWRSIGPHRGGRVLAVAGVPGQPQHFYFGSVNGGVWETRDAGRTWQPIFDDQPIGSIGAIAVADSDPKVLYVGTGEADMRSDIAQGDGVYRSGDGGKSWAHVGLKDSQQIGKILIDPEDPDTVYVAALGHPYGPNEERGVFRSRDGGQHWQRVLGEGSDTGAIDLAFEPGNSRVIYAAMWQTRRTPWNVYPPANGPGSGLYKSSDGGQSWQQILGNGFPDKVGRIGIGLSASAPQRVYAIVDGDQGGLYRSDDAGARWRLSSADIRLWQRGWYFGRVTIDPANADIVYVLNTIVLRSDDGGASFAANQGDNTGDDFHEMWIDPKDSNRQILGVDQGAIVSLNGGASWSSWHNQPTAQMYHVSTDQSFPYRVYGAQQDSGAVGLPSSAIGNARISMQQFKEITAGGESGMIAPDPSDPSIIYGGNVDRLDLKTEQSRNIDPTLGQPAELYRRTWTLPLAFNRANPKVLYWANQQLFRTDDGGEHWTVISRDLTREDPGVPPNLDEVSAANHLGTGPRRGVIYSIASSPLDARLLWVGTDDGLIWRSDDEGRFWFPVTPNGVGPWAKIAGLEASAFNSDHAYAAVDRHRIEDRRPYIYRTRDRGLTWTLIVDGIRDGDFVNAVRADPVRPGLLYAATELGVYISFDDGDHWHSLQMNLPRTSVRDLVVHDRDLVIATHGRGFWILDDVSALRQLIDPADLAQTRLYAPATSVRLRPAGFTGTPLPRDEPTSENPPFGAYLDYSLAATPKEPVRLSIHDAAGKLVRTWSSSDKAPGYDAMSAGFAAEWAEQVHTLKATPGLHRFVWSWRYPALGAAGDAYANGVLAPPGEYRVVLSVDGQDHVQTLTVVPDPRIDLPPEAYRAQFEFAREIEAAQLRLGSAQAQASALHQALKSARASAGAELQDTLGAYDARVLELAGINEAPNPKNAWAMPPRSTHSFSFLAQALGKLAHAIDSADAAPSPDARQGLATLTPMLEQSLSDWKKLSTVELAAVNAQLRRAGKARLTVERPGESGKTRQSH